MTSKRLSLTVLAFALKTVSCLRTSDVRSFRILILFFALPLRYSHQHLGCSLRSFFCRCQWRLLRFFLPRLSTIFIGILRFVGGFVCLVGCRWFLYFHDVPCQWIDRSFFHRRTRLWSYSEHRFRTRFRRCSRCRHHGLKSTSSSSLVSSRHCIALPILHQALSLTCCAFFPPSSIFIFLPSLFSLVVLTGNWLLFVMWFGFLRNSHSVLLQ